MEYSKWALNRVDELERRYNTQENTNDFDSCFEWSSGPENENVTETTKKELLFPNFDVLGDVTIFASVSVKFNASQTISFSLIVDGKTLDCKNISSTGGEESFFAIKHLPKNENSTHTCSVVIESSPNQDLNIKILSYALNVIGKCKKSEEGQTLDLDLFVPEENVGQEDSFLKTGEKLAVCYANGNNIFLFELIGPASAPNECEGTKITRARRAAVCYSNEGELFVARESSEGKLYVKNHTQNEEEVFVESDVQSFDIARFCGDQFSVVVLYVKNGQVKAKYLKDKTITQAQTISCEYGANKVHAVKGNSQNLIILVEGSKNQLIVGEEKPNTNETNYTCTATILAS